VRVPTSSMAASVRSAFSRAAVSEFSNPAMYWPSSSRACGSVGSITLSGAGATSPSRARARCSVLLTAAVEVPSIVATSPALKPSTSRSRSTARCRAGRYCRLAMSASRTLLRAVRIVAGSCASGVTRASGTGPSHATSGSAGRGGASGSSAGPPSPEGSARLPRCSSAVRHALVAMRYNQVRSDERPSKLPYERHARRYVSCTRSSASSAEPSMR
jgi:hypothetical protein